jgi:pyruvate kinase
MPDQITALCLTKVVATLGPASESPQVIRRMIEAGVDLFRLNFSHGSPEEHAERLATIREMSNRLDQAVAVLGDLPGPKLRVQTVPGEGIDVVAGDEIIFRTDIEAAILGDPPVFGCTVPRVIEEVEPGHRVLLADGAVRALAVERTEVEGTTSLVCRVTVGGRISTRKGINLPDSDISVPSITDRDWEWVQWAFDQGVDYLALSFVRRADEVRRLKERLQDLSASIVRPGESREPHIPIIAKIEKPQAVANIEAILDEADGIMVARGDLGVEMDLSQVPIVQKKLIMSARMRERPCIVATQMLESMIDQASPTRAEVSDVANAIFDATDAVMLSGETAVGKYPALAVETMCRIALTTEAHQRESVEGTSPPTRLLATQHVLAALGHGAWQLAHGVEARLVVCWSQSGGVARYLSRMGFRVPIIAFSSDPNAVRRMALLYGVTPVLERTPPQHRSDFARLIERVVVEKHWARDGDAYVAIAGKPFGTPGTANTIAFRRVGEMGEGHQT